MLDTPRILFITADASLYGSNRSLLNLLCSLQLKTGDYIVMTPAYGEFNKELDKLSIKNIVVRYGWECAFKSDKFYSETKFFLSNTKNYLINFIAKRKIADIVKRNNINIIHSNSSVISIGFEVAKKTGIKHVWHIREFITLDHGLTLFKDEEQYLKKIHESDAIICVSNSLANYFKVTGKGSIIYNAVAPKSEIADPVDKENYFLFCGAFTRNKGLHKALMAFADICEADKKVRLKIAGSFTRHNEYYFYILSLVEELKLSDRIDFLGYRKDARNLMNKTLGLLVCSEHEGMGRVTAEAMLFNCLVIGYDDKAGTSELITPNKTGLLFETKEELVLAMRYAMDEKSEVDHIIKQAKAFAVNNFTEEVFRSKMLSVYESLFDLPVKSVAASVPI